MRFSALMATLALAATAISASTPDAPQLPADPLFRHKLLIKRNLNGTKILLSVPSHCRQMLYTAGSCGLAKYYPGEIKPHRALVSIPAYIFDRWGHGQNNLLCGRTAIVGLHPFTWKHRAVIAGRNTAEGHPIQTCPEFWRHFPGFEDRTDMVGGWHFRVWVNTHGIERPGRDPPQ